MSYAQIVLALLLLSLLGTQRPALAQQLTAQLGVGRTLKSTILNEERTVFVHLPASYDTSRTSYPVLYLLDGTSAPLQEMIAITSRMRGDRSAPEMIIVAVVNTNRNRDMMPVVAGRGCHCTLNAKVGPACGPLPAPPNA
jgi:uncharacterized protein